MKKLVLAVLALVVVALLVGAVQRTLQNQGIFRTSAGKFRVPTPEKTQGGDRSLGWCGDMQDSSQGWFLSWRYQDKPFNYDEHHGIDREFFFECLMSLLPPSDWPTLNADVRNETNGGHRLAWIPTTSPKGSQHGGKVVWYCPDSKRMFIFYTWAPSESEAEARAAAFAKAPLDCHSGTPASPLSAPALQLPQGYQDAKSDNVKWGHKTSPATREDVWIGTGVFCNTKGESVVNETAMESAAWPIHGNYLRCGQSRALDMPSFPHAAVQYQFYHCETPDSGPFRPGVATVWACAKTGCLYSTVWLGTPLPPGRWPVRSTSFLVHPAFIDTPRCPCEKAPSRK